VATKHCGRVVDILEGLGSIKATADRLF